MKQLDEKLLRHWNTRILFDDVWSGRCGRWSWWYRIAQWITSVRRSIWVTVFSESLCHKLWANLAEMIQCWLLNLAQLLIEDEHQCSHNWKSILSRDLVHLIHWTPWNLLFTVLFPSLEVTSVQILLFMIDRRLSKYWHSIRHRFQKSLVTTHFDVVSAKNERLNASKVLLLAHRHSIKVQVNEIRNELQCEALQFIFVWSIEVVKLNAYRVKKLKQSKWIINLRSIIIKRLSPLTSESFVLSFSIEWIDAESSWFSAWRAANDLISWGSNELYSANQSLTIASAMIEMLTIL